MSSSRPNIYHRSMSEPAPMSAITVSPSRSEVRRTDPSLSFRVSAPGAQAFDIIVATDPSLFDPAHVHRRTPKNFRSSRQDFQGQAIDIATGFYLLPRIFLRDVISVDPRPTRLYYLAVAYADPASRQGLYSVEAGAFANAPSVGLSADLVAANLSKILGMAVERLGVVNGHGRVMSATTLTPSHLPDAIGGLPLATRPQPAPAPTTGWRNTSGGGASYAPRQPARTPAPIVAPPLAQPASRAPSAFVDEDFTYGRSASTPAPSGYRDLDQRDQPAAFQYDDGFDDWDTAPQPEPQRPTTTPIPPLDPTPQQQTPAPTPTGEEDHLVQLVLTEGIGGRYEALSLDGGFRGRFGPSDPYYQRAHDGLRIGPHQAMQDSGELGELLTLMHSADTPSFAQIFGPDAQALLDVTNAPGPSGIETAGGRSARVQPIAGSDLWEEPWVERFRAAARLLSMQAAMRGQIIARRLDPIRPLAAALGLNTPRGTAMLLAAAILRGASLVPDLIRAAVNPFDTPARLGSVLDALGFADLGAFRTSRGLPPGDIVDSATHVALLQALLHLGADSPVQVPDAEAIMDALVTTAGPGMLGDALLRLRMSTTFGALSAGV